MKHLRVVALAVAITCALPPGASHGLILETDSTRAAFSPIPERTFEDVPLGRFSKARAMRHVRVLSRRIGVRVRARPGERRAAKYAARKLRAYGYETQIQRFPVDGRTSRNVVAWWPGAQRYPVVVGGHIDTVPHSPGANDNASGTATILELARLVAGKRPARFVRFVAFGSEEYGEDDRHHLGSYAFVRRLRREGRSRLAGMVSVDMIGDGRPLIVGNSGIAHDVVARTLYRTIREAGIGVTYRTMCDCSDNGPFERGGIPASFAYSGSTRYYHSPRDTFRKVEPRDVFRTGRALKAFIERLGPRMLRRFRRR